ncbi:MAG TPA: hypothetical protein VF070_19415 [Streptosporangiaceae bacterium]
MTAAPAENPVTGPVDSLEVRWIFAGPLGRPVRDWFGRFPARTETRQDTYLLRPLLGGLSVKLRDRGALDVKSYLGSPAMPSLPVPGRPESWRKWSFGYDPQGQADTSLEGWVAVRKQRRGTWIPLAAGQDPAPGPPPADQPGCAVELTEIRVSGGQWWTLGFEATGPAGLRPDALQRAAALMFARPLPTGTEFSLDNSRSYAQWLNRSPGFGSEGTTSQK